MINYLPAIPLALYGTQLSIIDFKTHRLPNRLVGWFTAIEIMIIGVTCLIVSDLSRLMTAFAIAVITTIVYLLLYLLSRGSLGMGDVKFSFPLGLCVGWYSADYWLVAIFVSFLIAGLVAAIGLLSKQMTGKSRIAFGPFMFFGALAAIAFM